MSSIPGTVVGAKIVPTDTADVYGTHDALYGAGGWRSVDTTTARNAIPALQRQEGMVVVCTDSNAMYQLVDGITDGDWALLTTGVSGSGVAGNLTSWASSTDLSSAPAYVSSNQIYVTGPLHVANGGTGFAKTTEIVGNATGYTAFAGTTLAVVNKGDAEIALYADTTKNCNIIFCDNYSGSVPAYLSWSNTNTLLTFQSPSSTFSGTVGIGTTVPGLKLDIQSTNASLPATTGTAQNGVITIGAPPATTSIILNAGINSAAPYGGWLQASSRTDLSINYPLLLNPNGGNVGIGTTSPACELHVQHDVDDPGDLFRLMNASADTSAATRMSFGTNLSVGAGKIVMYGNGHATRANIFEFGTPAAGDIRFSTNDTDRITIDGATGLVGIGTTNPGTLFTIQQSADSQTGGLSLVSVGTPSYWNIASISTGKLYFNRTGTGDVMVLDSSGNVGIGTTVPGLKLDIQSTNASLPATTGTAQNGVMTIGAPPTTTSIILNAGINSVSPYGGWLQASDRADLSLNYPLLLNPNGGNVGIGTTSPSVTLEVVTSVLDADPSPDVLILRRNVTDSPTNADKGPNLAFSGPAVYGEGAIGRVKAMAQSSSLCCIVVSANAGPAGTDRDIAHFLHTQGGTRNPDATAALELLPGSTIQSEGYHWQDIYAQCSYTGFVDTTGTVRAYKLGRTAIVQFDVRGNGNTSSTLCQLNLPAAYASGPDSTAYGIGRMYNGTWAAGDIIQFPSSASLVMAPTVGGGYAGWSPYGARSMHGEFVINCGMS